ncbi:hypothetical protein GCM10010404_52510 [Nonomuraea africana]
MTTCPEPAMITAGLSGVTAAMAPGYMTRTLFGYHSGRKAPLRVHRETSHAPDLTNGLKAPSVSLR